MSSLKFLPQERRAVLSITALFALRIVGLFLLYPVLTLYAQSLPGQTPLLIGWAFGIYGLAQAALQIPFGMLSDRFGRKPLIAIGLIIFGLGSILAAFSDHIIGLILGRFLQGAGAISAVCTAALSDIVMPERRAKAMAFLGISIGAAFSVSIVAGPYLGEHWGVPGIFILIALACAVGLVVLYYAVPEIPAMGTQPSMRGLHLLFHEPQVLKIALGIGILHGVLTAMFMVVPSQLISLTGTSLASHAYYYAIGVVLVFVTVFPMLRVIEKYQWHHQSLVAALLALCFSQGLLWAFPQSVLMFFIALIMFFLAFNLLEASLPAAMSRVAPLQYRGAAMGLYSTFQFTGTFIGGVLAGLLLQYVEASTLFLMQAFIILLWLILIINKGASHG
jgi:MFS family permease